jgi:hypothetical protein
MMQCLFLITKDKVFLIHYTLYQKYYERAILAFDAEQHGKGFSFGDGKTNRYYLDGWKKQIKA